MKTRLLAYYHDIRVSQPVNGENGRLLGFTREYPDRAGQFCFECTREQWAELQRFRWASPIIENGFLIPDVDFVAKDGAVFQDAAECIAHERALTVPAWRRAFDSKCNGQPSDLCGNHERIGRLEINTLTSSEDEIIAIIKQFEVLTSFELRDHGMWLELLGTHPAFEFMLVPDLASVLWCDMPKYQIRDGQIKQQCGQEVSRLAHTQKIEGSIPSTATTLFDWRSEFAASQICSDVVQYNDGVFCNAATEHFFWEWVNAYKRDTDTTSQVGETVNASGFEPDITGSTPVPAAISAKELFLLFTTVATKEETQTCVEMAGQLGLLPHGPDRIELNDLLNKYVSDIVAIRTIKSGEQIIFKHRTPENMEHVMGLAKQRGLKATLEGDNVIVVDPRPKPNPELESKLLTALADGLKKAKPLAELTGSSVEDIKECVAASELLMWSGPYLKTRTIQ